MPGVTAIESSAVLATSFLSAVDLLVVTNNFSTPLDYTASEVAAVAQFVARGGAVLMIAEFNTIFWDPNWSCPAFVDGQALGIADLLITNQLLARPQGGAR
jgi:hypothetical protein